MTKAKLGVVVAAALGAALLAAGPAAAKPPGVGDPAPEFTLKTFDGEMIPSSSLRGKVVVLNYWATWCGPCRVELPELDNYMRRHRKAPLAMYAVATEGSVPQYKLRPLASVLSFPMVAKMKVKGLGVMKGVPTNYVIDKRGVIRYAKAGAFDERSLEAIITPLLAEPAPEVVAAAQPAPGDR